MGSSAAIQTSWIGLASRTAPRSRSSVDVARSRPAPHALHRGAVHPTQTGIHSALVEAIVGRIVLETAQRRVHDCFEFCLVDAKLLYYVFAVCQLLLHRVRRSFQVD